MTRSGVEIPSQCSHPSARTVSARVPDRSHATGAKAAACVKSFGMEQYLLWAELGNYFVIADFPDSRCLTFPPHSPFRGYVTVHDDEFVQSPLSSFVRRG